MVGCRQTCRLCVRSEIDRRDLGGREGLGGRLRGLRALRREGEVGTEATDLGGAGGAGVGVRGGAGASRSRVGRSSRWEAEIEPR